MTSFPSGVSGARALRHVVVELSQEAERAKNLELLMVIAIVWVLRRRIDLATLTSVVSFLDIVPAV